ncbi:Similar to Jph3: Junctophilin-3 (Mus musculus) [Cotesia congregata]|uniref:Similar to Jph3: Junctophilin-3 (Mus musculus) n=1 Tax=Cotesia congregata TaxID=51543 RepID=A0A8J2H952_COTCN|nr:Similar to Jph3: Junctophilin-3 (Mus musculus) [Cotesia congregata]
MNAMQQQQSQGAPAPNGVAGGAQLPPNPAQVSPASGTTNNARLQVNGGRFDFDDGGTYCGGWEDGKAHGHGVCTGPKGQGAYSGSWHYGFEVSGVYTWPSGSAYEGQWQNGKRHGLGMETRGRWIYRGEWTQGFKGRYGVRQSTTSTARYEGTWASGLQDGYGSETYADSVRTSAPFGLASHYKPPKQIRASLTSLRSTDGAPAVPPTPEPTDRRDRRVDDSRGGFVLKARSDDPPARRKSLTEKSLKKGILSGLKIRKQRSTGDLEKRGTVGSIRSNASSASWMSTESSQSFGISERSDGLRYEGEWFNNRKYGYGVTTFRDGSKEEGKYKNNVLITSQKKKHLFLIRSAKFRERIDAAVSAAQRSSKMALQKADIAISRTATSRGKAELADIAADHARQDSELAQQTAKQFAPDFRQPGLERLRNREIPKYVPPPQDAQPPKSILSSAKTAAESTPAKSSEVPSPPALSAGGTAPNNAQNFNQSIRRPSMKAMTNQIPILGNANQNTGTAQNSGLVGQYGAGSGLGPGPVPGPGPGPAGAQSYNYGGGSGGGVSDGGQFMVNSNAYAPGVSQFGLGPMPNTQQQDRPTTVVNAQSLNDRLDHYKRPPSRDSSVDRYRTNPVGSGAATPTYTPPTTSQFEGALRRRGTGQEIIPSAVQPKRTESLYVAPARSSIGGGGGGGGATSPLSREEVSVLSSMRREEIRRQIDESERLRANPLLYLVSPQVKDWFSRQQLVMLVLFINISLALMFFKLLT